MLRPYKGTQECLFRTWMERRHGFAAQSLSP